jgi:broad specificity phosphatase PhoE
VATSGDSSFVVVVAHLTPKRAAVGAVGRYTRTMSRELDDLLMALALKHLASSSSVGLLVRHAERGPIADLARHHEVLLTDDGVAAAERSGRRLGDRLQAVGVERIAFVHSPVERCAQTARGIAAGAQAAGLDVELVGVVEHLGANYLRDPQRVAEAASKDGAGFVRHWFNGQLAPSWIAPLDDVANGLISALVQHLQRQRFVVGVSHDWNIAAVREHALGLRFEDVGWPPFLDGLVVHLDADGRPRVECVHAQVAPGGEADHRQPGAGVE